MVEAGSTFGDVARTLNAEGVKGRRGKPWVSRTVRTIVHNDVYAGQRGYPAIIDAERHARILAGLRRLDASAVQRRKGGRKPTDPSYFLRGVAFCGKCGAALYTRDQAAGRVYVCANRRQGTGLCDAPAIPAGLIEANVLNHLDVFVGSVEQWLSEQVNARHAEHKARMAAVERERQALADLDRQREQHMAAYSRMVGEGDRPARYALGAVDSIDREREQQAARIAEAEAIVSEWTAPPDVDAALDFYTGLLDLVQGKVRQARGTVELTRALGQVLAGLWAEVEPERDRLLVEFELRAPTEQRLPGGEPLMPMFASRPTLPPRRLDDYVVEPRQTETQTLV